MARTRNYVNNVDLLEELYLSIERDELTNKGLDMLMKLAQRTIRKLYYSCEDTKQHCLSEAYLDIWKRWRKFDPYVVRSSGFELSQIGRSMKFYKDSNDRLSIIQCESIDDIEIGVRKNNKLSYVKISELNVDWSLTREGFIKANPELFRKPGYRLPKDMLTMAEYLAEMFNNDSTGVFDPTKTRVKVKYKVQSTSKDIPITYAECFVNKTNAVVKDPNPFSYFTSICINGYAKGYKELNPKKDQGRFISLDAGFGSEDGTDMFNA